LQVYFIRHAQSENNAKWENLDFSEESRLADPGLTQKGILQANETARFLGESHPEAVVRWIDPYNVRGFFLTHLYCSLMLRAVQTGTILSQYLKIPLEGHMDLHEIGGIYLKNGQEKNDVQILHGKNRDYFGKEFPELILPDQVTDKGWWRGGLEPPEGRFERAERVLSFLKHRHLGTDDKIGVITHGGFFLQLYRKLFRIDENIPGDLDLPYRLILNNCSISRFDFFENEFLLLYQNRVDFLVPDLIT
jgi:2,3-bisphosphoglycerate-dependent phosphoglycerate mutase